MGEWHWSVVAVKVTFEAKIKDASLYPLFESFAALFGCVERALFRDRYVRGEPLRDCKRRYLGTFGITARMFNAVAFVLEGKVKAAREARGRHLRALRNQIRALGRSLAELKDRLGRAEARGSKWRLRFQIHQKKRRLACLKARLAQLEAGLDRAVPPLCFGSGRLFRAQFHLGENGYSSHEEWLERWCSARSSGFLCLGSRDETSGNQTCTLFPDGSIRLRVPDCLAPSFGRWVMIGDVRFRRGEEALRYAISAGQAISYRFFRREKKGKVVWYLGATVEQAPSPLVTDPALGALGVDLNPHLLAVAQVDRYGNPVAWRHLPLLLHGRRREQVTAALGDAVAEVVAWARAEGIPIVVEELDFEKKKAELRERNPRYARLLSAFSYRKFWVMLNSRAAREGVGVMARDPALTSVIGEAKFGSGYGLSPHAAGAVAIARRGLRFGERLRSRSALVLPVRNRTRHVWSDWRRLSQGLRARGARGRRLSERDRGRGLPLSRVARAAMPHGPPGDGLSPVPGWESPAQTVGKAVRPACLTVLPGNCKYH
ncbi:MAG: transposase [Bacillota bacterium]|nr:transposase [Bacillota bacterium]